MERRIELPNFKFYLQNSPGKGRGVFSSEEIPSRTLVHISPVLLFPFENKPENEIILNETENNNNNCNNNNNQIEVRKDVSLEREILNHYTYTWGRDQALAIGLGSMFNHSRQNNVGFIINKEELIISYYTLRDIRKDEELCINYGNNLWFDDNDDVITLEKENNNKEEEEEESESEDENFLIKVLK